MSPFVWLKSIFKYTSRAKGIFLRAQGFFGLNYFAYYVRYLLARKSCHLNKLSNEATRFIPAPLSSIHYIYTKQGYASWVLDQAQKHCSVEIVSEEFGHKISPSSYVPIQSWALVNNISTSHNAVWTYQKRIDIAIESQSLESLIIDSPLIALSYQTSHYGHFCAEVLGSIFFLLAVLPQIPDLSDRKILLLAPSKSWELFLENLYPNNSFLFLDPLQVLNRRVKTVNCLVAPLLSSMQSLNIARNVMLDFLSKSCMCSPSRKYVYLCVPEHSRVANKLTLFSWLKHNQFQTINPLEYSPLELFTILYNAHAVLSEPGSIALNCILARTTRTWVLSPNNDHTISLSDYAGGIVFNHIADGFLQEIPCSVSPQTDSYRKHFYAQMLHVEIESLLPILES